MITADAFVDAAASRGFNFFSGVPCSYLTALTDHVVGRRDTTYVGAAQEGEAVAIAAGAWLCGRETVVMCQNSGLGNAINPLTSLNRPFRIPTLLIVTWRGRPGEADEPQHVLMGRITPDLLQVVEVPYQSFPRETPDIADALETACGSMRSTGRPFALIMQRGSVAASERAVVAQPVPLPGRLVELDHGGPRPTRYAVLERLLGVLPQQACIIATTGMCGRELFTLSDREQHLYMVGSMGCASATGLGVALNASRPVVVLDGDGAALMKLGNLATIGAHRPARFLHILLDNGVYDSTGGQATVSGSVDFARIALGCGYAAAWACDDLDGCETAVRQALWVSGPVLLHVRIRPGSLDKLGRPTLPPHAVAERFKAFLAGPRIDHAAS